MIIHPGAIYWVQFRHSEEEEPRIRHPHVVIECDTCKDDMLSESITICALTTNARKFYLAGNVLLNVGEANLTQRSVVEVAKIFVISRGQLGDYIGTLSQERVEQILAGMQFIKRSFLDC